MTDDEKVFPMYVGVILLAVLLPSNKKGIPHVCGGDPLEVYA